MLGEVPEQPYSLAAQLHLAQVRGRQPKMLKLNPKTKKTNLSGVPKNRKPYIRHAVSVYISHFSLLSK